TETHRRGSLTGRIAAASESHSTWEFCQPVGDPRLQLPPGTLRSWTWRRVGAERERLGLTRSVRRAWAEKEKCGHRISIFAVGVNVAILPIGYGRPIFDIAATIQLRASGTLKSVNVCTG